MWQALGKIFGSGDVIEKGLQLIDDMHTSILTMTLLGEGDIDAVKAVLGDFYIGEIMLTIVFFYFGGGAFEGAMKSRVK